MSYDIDYLTLLSQQYPTVKAASTEIIRLQSRQKLPKLTEHFMSDIHGEYESFLHILKNASGVIKDKITQIYGRTLSERDRQVLATLIYYPEQKLEYIKDEVDDINDWYKITLYRLIEICRVVASKYTRAKIREFLPEAFGSTIDELIHANTDYGSDKESYYNESISTIVELGQADDFIVEISTLIQTLAIGRLHIIGDIFDRGPGAAQIMDILMNYHSVDIQWGNHDVLWMGAAAGQQGCVANVVRICARYANLEILEDGYGINLLPLATFALNTYRDDPCSCFELKDDPDYDPSETMLNMKMHKAISIIQFKIEGQIIKKNPGFKLEHRNLLHLIDYENGLIELDGKTYELLDKNFPTIDPKRPYVLTEAEEEVLDRLTQAFVNCEKLQSHMHFLLSKGGLYKVYNNNLLYHGCIPLNEDGSFKSVKIYGRSYKGKALYEVLESYVRKGFYAIDEKERKRGKDMMWYIWLSENSPLFGKDKMATFERYFLAEKETHKEKKNPYYDFLENDKVVDRILKEFGLEHSFSHIINGHMPVKSKNGENPMKCGGKVFVIDGGFSRAYQKQTGIAGYTLIYNSYGMILSAHEPFESKESAIENETDIHSDTIVTEIVSKRQSVLDTDVGKELVEQIHDLEFLLEAYRSGRIAERL